MSERVSKAIERPASRSPHLRVAQPQLPLAQLFQDAAAVGAGDVQWVDKTPTRLPESMMFALPLARCSVHDPWRV